MYWVWATGVRARAVLADLELPLFPYRLFGWESLIWIRLSERSAFLVPFEIFSRFAMYSVTCSGLFRSAFLLILIRCLLVDSIVYLLKFWFFK